MNIVNAQFVTSVSNKNNILKTTLPEIAISGRSNVGKSSFINMLANRNKLAKTSQTPGKTRLINYFNFDNKFMLVDLPGFGYAQISKQEQIKWGELIEGYLLESKNLKRVLQLVDIRHLPTANDIQMVNFLYYNNIPFNVILTKADKLSATQIIKQREVISRALKMTPNDVYVTSSLKKTGKEEVLTLIENIINTESIKEQNV